MSAPPLSEEQVFKLVRNTIGPFQYGLLLCWGLMGLLLRQLYVYETRFAQRDTFALKIFVYGIVCAELMLTGVLTHAVHALVIEGWGDPSFLLRLPWSGASLNLSTSIVAAAVQSFFVWRLWKINRESWIIRMLACFISVLIGGHICSAIASTYTLIVESHVDLAHSRSDPVHRILTLAVFSTLFAADFLISLLMVFSLRRLRQQSDSVKSTKSTITRLIYRAIETGLISTVFTLIQLIMYMLSQRTTYYVTPLMALGRLYPTVLMFNLNGRGHFSGASEVIIHSIGTNGPLIVAPGAPEQFQLSTIEVASPIVVQRRSTKAASGSDNFLPNKHGGPSHNE